MKRFDIDRTTNVVQCESLNSSSRKILVGIFVYLEQEPVGIEAFETHFPRTHHYGHHYDTGSISPAQNHSQV
jgi:hypothetical protein